MSTHHGTNDAVVHSSVFEQRSWYLLLSAVLVGLVVSRLARRSKLQNLPFPPGPKGVPILGNALQVFLAEGKPWHMYRDWLKEYTPNGDMLYVSILGQPILVLGSLKATTELLDKRGSTYSDRTIPPSMELLNMDWSLGIMNYGPMWKAYRRMFHQYYNKNQIHTYSPILERQTRNYLRKLLSSPQHFLEDTRNLFGGIIIEISYGLTTPSEIEPLIKAAEAITSTFADCAKPGFFLVDILPFLRWVPSWAPGAAWKKRLEAVGQMSQDVCRKNFNDALEKAKQAKGSEDFHVSAQIISKLPSTSDPGYMEQEQMGRSTALIAYVAGADTTVSSAQALFVALANHPECQRLAQEEIEAVTGGERLPTGTDLPQLPCTQAIVRELSRWFTVTPLTQPHVSSQDDSWEGYYIPKGTIVMPNTWAIMHDPETFEDPLEFKPERYLMRDPDTHQLKINPDVLSPESAAFGYGRRICPGRHLSGESLTLMTASLLAVFDVKPPKDASGRPIKVELETGLEIIQAPKPFKVDIIPRSERHAALLTAEE